MKLVLIESPYAASTPELVQENVAYARACVMDSLLRGEAPYASHLFYTQEGLLDDTNPIERKLGIEAGLAWGRRAELTAVYTELGISKGMELGIQRARDEGRVVEYRTLSFLAPFVKSRRDGPPVR